MSFPFSLKSVEGVDSDKRHILPVFLVQDCRTAFRRARGADTKTLGDEDRLEDLHVDKVAYTYWHWSRFRKVSNEENR